MAIRSPAQGEPWPEPSAKRRTGACRTSCGTASSRCCRAIAGADGGVGRASIGGGYLLDQLAAHFKAAPLLGDWNLYHFTFLFAWITRTLGVTLLLRLREPNQTA